MSQNGYGRQKLQSYRVMPAPLGKSTTDPTAPTIDLAILVPEVDESNWVGQMLDTLFENIACADDQGQFASKLPPRGPEEFKMKH